MFGNPGTTELPIMEVMPDYPQLKYVLGLYESVVVGMADGYARASNRLAACNVHVAPGLGNAMGALYNAKFSGSPLILTAGQQEQGHGLLEPLLYAPLVPVAQPLVKWAVEVTRAADLPLIVRRAAKVALTPPTGPVFISLPGDVLEQEARVRARAADPRRRAQPPVGRGAGAPARRAARGEQPGDPRRPRARRCTTPSPRPPSWPSCSAPACTSRRFPTARSSRPGTAPTSAR